MAAPTLEEALDRAARAYDAGDFAACRDAASVAVSLDPDSVEGLHFLAAALAALGEVDQADRAYHEALALAPDDAELLLGATDLLVQDFDDDPDALHEAIELAARGAAIAREDDDAPLAGELVLLEARAFIALGRARTALHRLDDAARLLGADPEVALQRGIAHFELRRLDDAAAALRAVVDAVPEEALGHWYLGLVAERAGDLDASVKHLETARRLDPDAFPSPVMLSHEAFDQAVDEALGRLPDAVRRWMENVAVLVEDVPTDDDLDGEDPPLSPTILGVFRGAPLKDKMSGNPWDSFPSSIVLYQRNLERACATRAELVEQIEITVLHEVGHFLGLDEDELDKLGLH